MLHSIGGNPDDIRGDRLAFRLQSPDDQGVIFGCFEVVREHFDTGGIEEGF